ncbi:MAG: hypothetical protein FWG64_03260 [Firmicutes bacterium]|nr:hypothetical protein [Bacillota bacterium]
MIDLYDYKYKNVKITAVNGKTFVGFVDIYIPAIDDIDGFENIAIIPQGTNGYVVGFYAKDIAQIEILETAEPIEITLHPKTHQPQAVAIA